MGTLHRRLVYAAHDRCECGAGFAYDGNSERDAHWDCSSILLGDALIAGEHGAAAHSLPCEYFDLVSERQPGAMGATTRP
jgi:hypothetical protein